MQPVLTPDEMAAIDAAAPVPLDELVERAGRAVARTALELLGGTYGRRVVVVAGPGNNGADGRVAARLLRSRGVRVEVVDATNAPTVLGPCDLVIDAAFGSGLRSPYDFPATGSAHVLSVDVPSGISGLTGQRHGSPPRALVTLTFAALRPGVLLGDGPSYSGEVRVADIGLDVSTARIGFVEPDDVVAWVPARADDDHKWRHAVWLIAGSAGMSGAAGLCSAATLRGGAGYVRLSTPGVDPAERGEFAAAPIEAVGAALPLDGWADEVRRGAERFAVVAVGPGLGRSDVVVAGVRELAPVLDSPLVLDGDALWALGTDAPELLAGRSAPTVLTPHDGEFERLTGSTPGQDRIGAARSLAASTRAVVLLKGPTTVVADADGQVLLVRSGGARLASAGTGDVLTGLVSAHLALGAAPPRAAAAAAQLHGLAAELGHQRSLVASDLPGLVAAAWDLLLGSGEGRSDQGRSVSE